MQKNDLNLLTIGNSFTDSLAVYLPQVAASVPGCSLNFERADHGGCELHRHWGYIRNEEHDTSCRMYQDPRTTMKSILQKEAWDVITIQQASHFSWRPETYQPFADQICDYIRKYAPGAEIMIQQTWAYREDDPRIMPGGEWNWDEALLDRTRFYGATVEPGPFQVSQTEMYEALTRCYTELARHQNLRIIPTGFAVQLARQNEKAPFRPYDPELIHRLRWPDLPPQSGDVVGQMHWHKNQNTGEMQIWRDCIHLNQRGQYLQACLWFAMLYGRPVSDITFVPDEISNEDAAFLRSIAGQAADQFPQVSKS